MSFLLFRIDAPTQAQPSDALASGLGRHLRSAALLSVLVKIGARQQAYVALEGCAGCAAGRCLPGCRVELLRRTLRGAFGAAGALQLVPKGLAARSYTRVVLARPTSAARPLAADLLHPYQDARLTLHWHAAPQGRWRLAAALASGPDGPDPAAALRDRGWQAIAVPRPATRWALSLYGCSFPQGQPLAGAWPHQPALLLGGAALPLPAVAPEETGQAAPAELVASAAEPQAGPPAGYTRAGLRESAYEHLKAILEGRSALDRQPAPAASEAPEMASEPSRWPRGPGEGKAAMQPAQVEALAAALLADLPQAGTAGVTRRRVAVLLEERHKEHAAAMLLWLEAAGLLEQPHDAGQPYRRPRALTLADMGAIATRLKATPCPSIDDMLAAKAKGL